MRSLPVFLICESVSWEQIRRTDEERQVIVRSLFRLSGTFRRVSTSFFVFIFFVELWRKMSRVFTTKKTKDAHALPLLR